MVNLIVEILAYTSQKTEKLNNSATLKKFKFINYQSV